MVWARFRSMADPWPAATMRFVVRYFAASLLALAASLRALTRARIA